MASIYKELRVDSSPEALWQRVRDVGNIASLMPNFLQGSHLADEHTRSCALPDGGELREQIITVDDDRRRVVYSIVASPMQLNAHSASMQVLSDDEGSKLVWVTDFLPDEAAAGFGEALDAATQDLANTLRTRATA